MEENTMEMENTMETTELESMGQFDTSDDKKSGHGLGITIGAVAVLGCVAAAKAVHNKYKAHKEDKESKPKKKFHIGFVDVPCEDEDVDVETIPSEDVKTEETK
ncbi:hypothetical protein DW790_05990 [Firmicutes bacterium AM31-12AC]|nr:hypothetical protein DW790_05990 [Firmicutes bacterium AM31-12AC]